MGKLNSRTRHGLFPIIIALALGLSGCALNRSWFKCGSEKDLEYCLRESGFSGVVLAMRGEDVLFSAQAGAADVATGRTIAADDRFLIGSVTKQFTAAAIMLLREDGKIELDRPVEAYLPGTRLPTGITIQHLLSHTSGLAGLERADFDALKDKHTPAIDLVARFGAKEPEFAPGKKFRYSNEGYILLGAIIEARTGKSWSAFMEERIFGPLGMRDTGYQPDRRTIEGLAVGYSKPAEPAEGVNLSLAGAAGGLYSTAADLARWSRGLLGGKLLSEEAVSRMVQPNLDDYGYGLVTGKRFDRSVLFHNGRVDGYFSFVAMFPDDAVAVFALGNTERPLGPVVRSVAERIFNGRL